MDARALAVHVALLERMGLQVGLYLALLRAMPCAAEKHVRGLGDHAGQSRGADHHTRATNSEQ